MRRNLDGRTTSECGLERFEQKKCIKSRGIVQKKSDNATRREDSFRV